MQFADLALSRRLEQAEGHASAQFAAARRKVFPQTDSEWMQYAGAYLIFDGIDSPVTQTFGLGLFDELTPASLDFIERFFLDKGAHVDHEVSPHAGASTLNLLCARGYRPIEISNVLYRAAESLPAQDNARITVRLTSPEEAQLWSDISSQAWIHDHPDLIDFFRQSTAILSAREQSPCFLAEYDGEPSAAGSLSIHEGVALLAGAATIARMRRRGLQSALLAERMRYAFETGCDLIMMAAEAGSDSQRNAERKGFQIAYTRIKWRLSP